VTHGRVSSPLHVPGRQALPRKGDPSCAATTGPERTGTRVEPAPERRPVNARQQLDLSGPNLDRPWPSACPGPSRAPHGAPNGTRSGAHTSGSGSGATRIAARKVPTRGWRRRCCRRGWALAELVTQPLSLPRRAATAAPGWRTGTGRFAVLAPAEPLPPRRRRRSRRPRPARWPGGEERR